MHYVYVLRGSSNPLYYVGYTSDLRQRLAAHNAGKNLSTKRGVPWSVLYYEAYLDREQACRRERQLKHR